MVAFLRKLAPILGELSDDGRTVPRYTWGGKGWGGATADGRGLDCSGFACALLWRVGRFSMRESTNTDGLWAMGPAVAAGAVQPLDLVLFGDNDPVGDMSHVGVMVSQGAYLDFGGGGSRTHPGGTDWPPKGPGLRLKRVGERSDLQGFRRVRGTWSAADVAAAREWARHVQAHRAGQAAPLSASLQAGPYYLRPMGSHY